jgi:hypothetical protein
MQKQSVGEESKCNMCYVRKLMFKFLAQNMRTYSGAKKYLVSHLLKKMRAACNFHHRYTSTMTDNIVAFFMNLFANYGGK